MSPYSLPIYKEKRKVSLPVSTSRGCPFLCNFCDRTVFGEKIRFFSAAYLSDMIDYLAREFHVNYLDIADENFCITKNRFLEICGILKEKFRAYNITWGCLLRSDSVEADTGRLLYDSGCRSVTFGIESGSKRMLRVYNKSVDLDSLADKCRIITSAGITLGGSFIVGGPEEDETSISETIQLIKKIELNFMFLWYFIPLPGAAISKGIEQKGKLLGDYSSRTGHHISFVPVTLSKAQIENSYRKIYLAFYAKPSHIGRVVKKYGWKRMFALCKDSFSYFKHFILR